MELIPAGAEHKLTAPKAKQLLKTVRPRDVVGSARRQLAADLIENLTVLDKEIKDIDGRLKVAIEGPHHHHQDQGHRDRNRRGGFREVGDVRRFPSRHRFATYTGITPLKVSSGEVAGTGCVAPATVSSSTPCTSRALNDGVFYWLRPGC